MQPPDVSRKRPPGPSKAYLCTLVILASGVLLWVANPPRYACVLTAASQTKSEMRTLSTALESYKMDHGFYPSDPASTDVLRPNASFDPDENIHSSAFLYKALAGDPNASNPLDRTQYYASQDQLKTTPEGETYIVDYWGNSIGYSTLKARHPNSHAGNNTTFDLWSTGGEKQPTGQGKWITNWPIQ